MPSRSSSGPSVGLLARNSLTASSSETRCGKTEPGTVASTRMSSSTRAVRIDVRTRHIHRSHPPTPTPPVGASGDGSAAWPAGSPERSIRPSRSSGAPCSVTDTHPLWRTSPAATGRASRPRPWRHPRRQRGQTRPPGRSCAGSGQPGSRGERVRVGWLLRHGSRCSRTPGACTLRAAAASAGRCHRSDERCGRDGATAPARTPTPTPACG